MTNLVNVNGVVTPEAQAVVPVLDRGFLFGDSIYEVMRTRDGVPFAFPDHFERLRSSADGLRLRFDLDDRALARRIQETLAAARNAENYVRIIVTRGTGTAPNIDVAYAPGPCTVIILVRDLPRFSMLEAHLQIVGRLRNDRRALDPAYKTGNYLNNVLGLIEAKASGGTDALFLNTEGHVTECSTSNLWVLRDGVLRTPPLDAGILAGITRKLLLEMCRGEGTAAVEENLTPHDVTSAEEVFVSASLRDLVPVTRVDGAPIGDGRPGPVTTRLAERFERFSAQRHADVYVPQWRALCL
ncbi:MAG: aminotransferase class IV [Planctomycetes bacterium]|nr:aminotransferase class IV [Planctomycetota bacterium]